MMNTRAASGGGSAAREWTSEVQTTTRDALNKARSHIDEARNYTRDTAQRFEETMHTKVQDAQDKAHMMADRAQSKAQEMRQHLAETRENAVSAAQQNAAHLQEVATQLLEQNPIAAGALMAAVGALIGGALPGTERERQMFARTGEKMRETTMQAMERGAAAVKEIAETTLDQAKEEVEKVGAEVREGEPALH